MFLHLIDDSHQLNHFIKRTTELYPGEHLFYVLSKNGQINKIENFKNVIIFSPTNTNIKKLVNEIVEFEAVFIHNLCYIKSKIVLGASGRVIFIWAIWGFDYYNVFPQLYRNIFLPYTKLVNVLLFKYSLTVKNIFYSSHSFTKHLGLISQDRIRILATNRIDFTINNMPKHSDVYKVIKSDFDTRFNGIYYSTQSVAKNLSGTPIGLGPNIYIGNSASNSSNHLDIFHLLKRVNLIDKKVIVPLSYGCARYRKFINFMGRIIFKENYCPLNNFYPLEKYNEVLLSCNVMIFNHRRAQAFGNIVFGIWAGHKIFLQRENPIYSFLKSIGIKVFSINENITSDEFSALNEENKKNNRSIIQKYFGEEQIQENFRQIMNKIKTLENSKLD